MAKYVNVESGDYRIRVEDSATIYLDTRSNSGPGRVIVTGDFEVQGDSLVVTTTNLSIEDNIIQLNRPSTDNGSSPILVQSEIVSGLEVNLGVDIDGSTVLPAAQWVYDGSIDFRHGSINGSTSDTPKGCWVPKKTNGDPLGIQAVSITTPNGSDLNLLGVIPNSAGTGIEANTGFVTVRGTTLTPLTDPGYVNEYSQRIASLVPNIGVTGTAIDDIIPNVAFVNDAITNRLQQTRQPRIQEGTFGAAETYVETQDYTVSSNPSRVLVGIDGYVTTTFRRTTTTISGVEIEGPDVGDPVTDGIIKSAIQDANLVLFAKKFGNVVVDDSLVLTPTSEHTDGLPTAGDAIIDPAAPISGTKIYAKPEEPGGSGIFFVNSENSRDEIISKNKAILYSMIF